MAKDKLLLVEGKDDLHAIASLLMHHDVPEVFDIKQSDGIGSLLESLPVRLKQSDLRVLGIVVDADTDLAARWQSLRNHLLGSGYPHVPMVPAAIGTIVEPPLPIMPRVGIWLMPDNAVNGMLEDFLRYLMPTPDALYDHAVASIAAIPERRFAEKDLSKATIHTWLAWQKDPGRPFGTAITARFLDADVPQVRTFIAWLKALFAGSIAAEAADRLEKESADG